jgi:hypothetical protein
MLKAIFKDKTGGLGQYEITEPYKEVEFVKPVRLDTHTVIVELYN